MLDPKCTATMMAVRRCFSELFITQARAGLPGISGLASDYRLERQVLSLEAISEPPDDAKRGQQRQGADALRQ